MKKILIVHTWGIGDWLFFTPVLKTLKETFPGAEIEVILGTPGTCNIVELYHEAHIRAVADVRKGPLGMVKAALGTWPTRYDLLLFTAGTDSRKIDKLAMIINARAKAALRTNGNSPRFINLSAEYDNSIHRVENNLKLLTLLGIKPPRDAHPVLNFTGNRRETPGSVLMHPGSDVGQAFKRWPAERFAAVSEELLKRGRRVSIVIGPCEVELVHFFSHLENRKGFRMYLNLPLKEVLNVIMEHQIFLSGSSGPGHIAGALDRRTFTIMGPTGPDVDRVYSSDAVIIRTARKLGCMPCLRPAGLHGCAERPCLTDINVESVIETLTE